MKRLLLILLFCLTGNSVLIGQIHYSGVQDIDIFTVSGADPFGFTGIFLDLESPSTTGTSEFNGWDVNFFFGGTGIWTSDTFQPVAEGTGLLDSVVNLGGGTMVSSASIFQNDDFSGSFVHLGSQFTTEQEGYLGFQYTPDESTNYYGWMRVTFTANQSGATIHDWAYNTAGNQIAVGDVGLVPEPATFALIVALIVLVPSFWIRIRNRK